MTEQTTTNPTDATAKKTSRKAAGPAAASTGKRAARTEVTPIPKNPSPKTKRRAEIAKAKADLAAQQAADAAEAAAAADCADAGLNAEATAECTGLVPPAELEVVDATDTTEEWETPAPTAQAEADPVAPAEEPEPAAPVVDERAELTFISDNGGVRTVRAAAVRGLRAGAMMPDPKAPRNKVRGSIVFIERTVVRGKSDSVTTIEVESCEPVEALRERMAALGFTDLPERPKATPKPVKAGKEPKAPRERAPREPRPEGARTRAVVTGRVRMSDEDALKRALEIIKEADGKTTRWKVIAQLRAEGNQVAWQPLFKAFDDCNLVPPGTRAKK